jgi:hypothetical protein
VQFGLRHNADPFPGEALQPGGFHEENRDRNRADHGGRNRLCRQLQSDRRREEARRRGADELHEGQSDAEKTCDASAAEKKLAGAAKTSFTKKCVSDAVGS